MTTLDILKGARRLIERPEGWTQHKWGCTNDGRTISNAFQIAKWRDDICALCFSGAIYMSMKDAPLELTIDAMLNLCGFADLTAAAEWNDAPERTHADVLKRLDDAIARLT